MSATLSCDTETGVCQIPETGPATDKALLLRPGVEIVYVGDPLCSWCWGVSPTVAALQAWCTERNLKFGIVAGGLRPGGGDPWNDEFKSFLRHHWEEIGKISKQPFSFGIFALEHFDYDSLPPCRAIVAARDLLAPRNDNSLSLHRFFAAVQHRFYAENDDPGKLAFYQDACAQSGIDFSDFSLYFKSPETEEKTQDDFRINRSWGVRGFPSFVMLRNGKALVLASGYTRLEALAARIEPLIGTDENGN